MRYALLLLLAGCGSGVDVVENHGYGWHTDAVGTSGLRVQSRVGAIDPSVITRMDSAFAEVVQCTGIQAPPPFVIVVPTDEIAPLSGFTYYSPPSIKLDANLVVLRHEYVHYLLIMSGFPREDNDNHNSPLFGACG